MAPRHTWAQAGFPSWALSRKNHSTRKESTGTHIRPQPRRSNAQAPDNPIGSVFCLLPPKTPQCGKKATVASEEEAKKREYEDEQGGGTKSCGVGMENRKSARVRIQVGRFAGQWQLLAACCRLFSPVWQERDSRTNASSSGQRAANQRDFAAGRVGVQECMWVEVEVGGLHEPLFRAGFLIPFPACSLERVSRSRSQKEESAAPAFPAIRRTLRNMFSCIASSA